MESHRSVGEMDNIGYLLRNVRRKGVRVWLEDDEIRFKAPGNALTPDEMDTLRQCRGQIVRYLKGGADAAAGPRSRSSLRGDRAPLTFSQLQHWNLYALHQRPALRHLASATQIGGLLDLDVLRIAVETVVSHHDALRTRIVLDNGTPVQEIAASSPYGLKIEDCSNVPGTRRESEILQRVAQVVLEPIDVSTGPLFEIRLLRFSAASHVLIIAMEHIISDMWSLNLLYRDIIRVYLKSVQGQGASLPSVPWQFSEYAFWQQNSHQGWLERHGRYWRDRLAGCARVKFPQDFRIEYGTGAGWSIVPIDISADLFRRARTWSRSRQTTVVMTFLTAYVALVLRWCNVNDMVIRYESNGRISPGLEDTIGYFSVPFLLRVRITNDRDTFADLLRRTIAEYCNAVENSDASYLEAQLPRPAFTLNTAFNWVSEGSKIDALDESHLSESIQCSQIPFDSPALARHSRDAEPFVVSFETDKGIVSGVWFPVNRFSVGIMDKFARSFLYFAEELLRDSHQRIKDLVICS